MTLYNINIETGFQKYLMENIQEAKDFASSRPDLECFITASRAKSPPEYLGLKFAIWVNYNPRYQKDDDLMHIEDYIAIKNNNDSYLNYLSMNLHSISDGYGSHSLNITEEQFDKLDKLYKSIIRNNNIDIIFED